MAIPSLVGRVLIIGPFPGDSVLPEARLHGTVVAQGHSKVARGTAYVVESDDSTKQLLRVYTADPRWFLVDLEDLPVARLPGMPHYIGGAIVRIYGKLSAGGLLASSEFPAYLGVGEILEREDQGLLSVPAIAHSREAAHVIELTRKDFGVELKLDLPSMREAAKVLASAGLEGIPRDIPDLMGIGRLLSLWGHFFGECLVRQYGGRWFEDPKLGLVILIPRGQLPPAKVRPYRVIECIIREKNPILVDDWLSRIEDAKVSTDFSPPLVE